MEELGCVVRPSLRVTGLSVVDELASGSIWISGTTKGVAGGEDGPAVLDPTWSLRWTEVYASGSVVTEVSECVAVEVALISPTL